MPRHRSGSRSKGRGALVSIYRGTINPALFLLAGALFACASSLPPGVLSPLPRVRTWEEAAELGASTSDPVVAAEIAWLEANDRRLARARLDEALTTTPKHPELLLRRALLSHVE